MKELKCPKCGNVFQVDEADYASIVSQVKNAEFNSEVERRLAELGDRYKAEQALATTKTEQSYQSILSKKELELGAKDAEIIRLKAQLDGIVAQKTSEMQLAVMEERNKAQQSVQAKETEITKLRSNVELEKREAQIHEAELIKRHEEELRMKQEQIDYYKDLKTKLSTKMVGETLEQHCYIEYEQYLRPLMPMASFEKDNETVDGTKGDFVFRDSEDGVEYISIMFEMKNESDTTATKHKNDEFLKKLDDDRKKKGCEFAVLVSLLEADNELYNNGIVNKSHLFPKMYVIRPQFFVPFINLLVQASKKSLEYKKQLILAQNKEVDVTNFETKIEEFKNKFGRHYEMAAKKYGDAIKEIDATIAKLQKVRESLVSSENNFRLANQDTEDLTIRKLTYKNPTMKAKFDEARNNGSEVVEVKDNEVD